VLTVRSFFSDVAAVAAIVLHSHRYAANKSRIANLLITHVMARERTLRVHATLVNEKLV